MYLKTVFSFLLFAFPAFVFSQTKQTLSPFEKLNTYLVSLQNDDDLAHANWGFCLMDPGNGQVLAQFDKDRSLVPASGMKAITTLSALQILGSEYSYTTTLEHDSIITEGVLQGNLYITGSGDPSLGSNRIAGYHSFDTLVNDWAKQLKSKGIKTIKGNIIADAGAFEDYSTPGSWNWDDIGQYYGAGPFGLNVYENAYTLYFSSTKTTSRLDSIYPSIEGLTVFNDTKVGGGDAFIFGAPDSYYRYVVGGVPASRKQFTVEGSMPDPPLFLATELKKALEKNSIIVEQQPTTMYALKRIGIKLKNKRTVLLKHTSAPISEMIKQTNAESINLYAEALLKTIGKYQLNDGSTVSGVKVVRSYWTEKGLDLKGFNMEDGSGLSRLNVITPQQMCNFLKYAYSKNNFNVFKNSLAVAGETGTMENLCTGTIAEGNIFAKSGSMSKVRSYSGYVKTQSGQLYCFSIIMNNYTCGSAEIRQKLEKMMVLMAGL